MHIPVLLKETLFYLNILEGRKFIDSTIGSGGHAFAILEGQPEAKVLGIDLDQISLDHLAKKVAHKNLGQRIKLVYGNFRDIDKIIRNEGFGSVDGVILDLGFSSTQLDDPVRGFSFQTDGPLDMRYDRNSGLTAEELVNRYQVGRLEQLFLNFGEEKFSRRIAVAIVEKRKTSPIRTSFELADIIRLALPASIRFKSKDSLRRIFQAIRIEVNKELENLEAFLPNALNILNSNGRLVIISFHSLEDRIVKEFFNKQAKNCICPPEFPTCICGKTSSLRVLTRKPVVAGEEELVVNSRSKAAKLRAAEKL